jgi:EAL domain-containing protein (putative c-di-GMP-specific phosphodiesterase class I)
MPEVETAAAEQQTPARTGRVESLRSERDRFVALAFTWGEILLELDERRLVLFAAGLTRSLLGYEPDDLITRRLEDILPAESRAELVAALDKARDRGRIGPATIRVAWPDGTVEELELSGYFLADEPARFFLAFRMHADAPPAAEESAGDSLYSASAFAAIARQRLQEPGARAGKRLSLIAVPGMDGLAGRLDGERATRLLGLVADMLRGHADGGDAAARLAEGRYGLLHAADLDLSSLCGRIDETVRAHLPAGMAEPEEIATATIAAEQELAEADVARGLMYAINTFQRSNRVGFTLEHLNRNLGAVAREAAADLNKMKRIIRDTHFDLAFQPIVAIGDGALHHFEVLARFRGRYGASPYRYIAFAEETGLIVGFDLAVARKTLAWLDRHPDMLFPLAINVSGQSIADRSFRRNFLALLTEYAVAPGRLMVEVTESARIEDLTGANAFLQDIREAGCPVCLDDFGAGAASFQYLTMLEVDVVKIDGPALHRCLTAPKGEAILSALTVMCDKVGIACVAEMIDGPEILAFAQRCGFAFAQGFFFGKPAADIASHLPAAGRAQ